MSWVYFIRATEGPPRIKIGLAATSVSRRIAELQTGSPVKLELLHKLPVENPLMVEREMHNRFAHLRVHGEWFDDSSGEIAAFCSGEIDLDKLRAIFVRIIPSGPQYSHSAWQSEAFILDPEPGASGLIWSNTPPAAELLQHVPGRVGYFWERDEPCGRPLLTAETPRLPDTVPEIVKQTVRDAHTKGWKNQGRYDFGVLGLDAAAILEILEPVL